MFMNLKKINCPVIYLPFRDRELTGKTFVWGDTPFRS